MAGLGGSSTGLRRGTGLLASDSASGLQLGTGLSGDTSGSAPTGSFVLLAGGTASLILLSGGSGFIKLAGT